MKAIRSAVQCVHKEEKEEGEPTNMETASEHVAPTRTSDSDSDSGVGERARNNNAFRVAYCTLFALCRLLHPRNKNAYPLR
jgi:hypothetical protein